MQKLTEIQVANFRSCKDTRLPLDDFTPLVGYNNVGKSNLISAIKWLLQPTALGAADFHDTTRAVSVSGTITGINEAILAKLDHGHRSSIEPYCRNGLIRIRRSQDTPGGGAKAIRHLVRDPDVTGDDAEGAWRSFPTGIPQALTVLFPAPIRVEAMQNVSDDLAKAKAGSTINDLIKEVVDPIKESHGADLQESLDRIGKRLAVDGEERAQELDDFDQGANEKLSDLFPGIQIRLHVPPPTLADLFKAGTIKAKEEGYEWQDFTKLGHGAQRSIQMALIRHLAEIKSQSGTGPSRTLLLIDEPELYLHPQGIEQIRAALRALTRTGYQIVYSTHSPLLLHRDELAHTVIVKKNAEQGTHTLTPLHAAVQQVVDDGPSQTRTLFEFGNAAQVFFSDKVLIAEGTTERAVIPDLFEALRQTTLGQSRIGLVELGGSTSIPKSMAILKAMQLAVKALADLDFAFKVAPQAGFLDSADSDIANAKVVFQKLASPCGIAIGNDGFPTKRGAITAAQAFAEFANDAEGAQIAEMLHAKLLGHGVWLWTKGTIEDHLGIDGKNEASWASYRARLSSEDPEDVIDDMDSIARFLDWLVS